MKRVVKDIEGVRLVSTNEMLHEVTVVYDNRSTREKTIVNNLEEAGFAVEDEK